MKVYRARENIYLDGIISIHGGTMFIVEHYLQLPFVQEHKKTGTSNNLNSLKYYDEVDLATLNVTKLTDKLLTS